MEIWNSAWTNQSAPPSWVPPSKTHQWTVRPTMSLRVTGVVIWLPGRSRIRASFVRMFSFRKRLLQAVKTVLAATKGSHRVTSRRTQKCRSPESPSPSRKKYPLSIKNSAMWKR